MVFKSTWGGYDCLSRASVKDRRQLVHCASSIDKRVATSMNSGAIDCSVDPVVVLA
jgi:hypothetical protein